ncbi:threonine aldolase family protein [uncultured Flavonifractor sp.]|uniref:threonine aldolase family protein n=1 Tax=uncultured Flavonifractor sp. TaxID=1193534 RepID=UPI002630808B|nr:aminotransferase class I/II-fold pyridoxal phosphate-dependent enzyme [uncultured Flavonifractor sp.]
MKRYLFRNDYSFGAHPKVMDAVCAVNLEGNWGYGDDGYTARAKERIRQVCGCPDAMVEFLVGGTQTNVVACAFLLKPWQSVICPTSGHLNGHEVGAFEATGHKIIPVEVGGDGKITPEMLPPVLEWHQDPHLTQPKLVYISNATENGAVYTKAELTALSDFCHKNGLLLFVDGARLGAALTSPANDLTLPEFAALVDAFYIGGTKNGAMFGEALVITRPELADGFFRMKKRMGAVMEKGWIQGVTFLTLFGADELYFSMARQGNEMAARLQEGLRSKGWTLWVESPTNQVFAVIPNEIKPQVDAVCDCEVWCPYDESHTVIRFVTCFHTSQADVDGLLSALPTL